MTASITTVLDLPGSVPSQSATITLPQSSVGRWRKSFAALRDATRHSLGIHVYSRRWNGGGWELAVRWSNGLMKRNGTGFCGRIFFDSLSLQVSGDEDLIIVPEQRAGSFFNAATGAAFVASGGGHYFPARGVLERRFLLVPKTMPVAEVTKLRDLALGFKAVRIPPPGGKPWGPALERMPTVNEAHYGNLFRQGAQQARTLLASGQPGSVRLGPSGTWAQLDLRRGALGPWIPDGDPTAGAPAGYEIEIAQGWQQVVESIELSAMAHECSMARNPLAWNDVDTGEQLSCHDWASSEAGRPVVTPRGLIMPAFLNSAKNDYPTFNLGSSPYQAVLDGYASEDGEHSIRAEDDAKVLSFTAGDPMAQDDIGMLFQHHRAMIFNDRADALPTLSAQMQAGWSKGFDGKTLSPSSPQGSVSWIGYQSLTRDSYTLATNPKHGSARMLRHFGWTLDLGLNSGERTFSTGMVANELNAVDSCGIGFREYHTPYIPAGVQGAQMFHEWIDKAAVVRACRMLGDPILMDRALASVRLCATKTLLNPDCKDAKWVYRERADHTEIDPITAGDHGPERMSEHILCVLGLAALSELDRGDRVAAQWFLEAGLSVDVPHATIAQRLAWIQQKTADISQYASWAAAAEMLG